MRNGSSGRLHQVELMPAGVAALDYNNDGCFDIFFANGAALPSLEKSEPGFRNGLYRNNCDRTFTDVTETAGVAGAGYSMAVAAADYDNDGYTDLFVAGVNRNILYRNRGGGRFEDVTARAGVSSQVWSISAGWFDYDNDGWLDLLVSNYVAWDPKTEPHCGPADAPIYCHPDSYRPLPNQLLHNNRDGTFTDVSEASGIARHLGKGMGLAFADFDRDGFTDVYVANDSVRSFLFRNRGDGTFQEMGLEAGVALREDGAAIAGMGADFRDFDNDGWPDLVVSGMINDTFLLFRNLGKRRIFEDFGARSGLLMGTRQLTGWSLGMVDFDNDGWKDLFFALSHFPRLERYLGRNSSLPNKVFRNLDGRRFVEVPAGLDIAALHHGAAFADFDNDGRVDAVVSALNGPAELYRNVSQAGQWAAFRLHGKRSNRQGLGAEVRLTLSDGRVLYNHATTSVGYACSSEPLVRFGLGAAEIAKVEIRWPGGRTQTLAGVKTGRIVAVEEAEAK
ncbi:MAG: CRTAC1 family protein [Acidobacteria bacterium]|nr:CRTAC1 family protein [Acidobacteriota bacterium]